MIRTCTLSSKPSNDRWSFSKFRCDRSANPAVAASPDHRCGRNKLSWTRNKAHYVQEEYIKEEQRNLKRELLRAEEEVKRIQSVPLFIGQFLEMVDANSGVVSSTTGKARQLLVLASFMVRKSHDRYLGTH